MSLVFACVDIPAEPWVNALQKELPDLEIEVWPNVKNLDEVEFALLWGNWNADLTRFPNLQAFLSLGAGVDHILALDHRPPHIPIVRLGDPSLQTGMVEFVLYNVLRFHRNFQKYEKQQSETLWVEQPQVSPSNRSVGLMGLGSLGTVCANALINLGFDVLGWSRRDKEIDKVRVFSGGQGLNKFLTQSEIIVCLLPLTRKTKNILNEENLKKLPPGSFVINAARGGHIVESDLLKLLDDGHIGGAALDVFEMEPLPKKNLLWSHPKVTVTPHVAALVNLESAAKAISETIYCCRNGLPLKNIVDPIEGY
ncbi:MAG: glyoxylate/hydroxypyruvate reductase A [Rhodospirillaceae bacterium]|nr:glyoxylate/hydroxypyruvate reductase A [Rhodospirillaceae bacterium]